jgi:hypothetical protein
MLAQVQLDDTALALWGDIGRFGDSAGGASRLPSRAQVFRPDTRDTRDTRDTPDTKDSDDSAGDSWVDAVDKTAEQV